MSNYITNEQLKVLTEKTDELIKNNFSDMDTMNNTVIEMCDVLGIEPLFRTYEDFDKFMQSDEPLVLF